MWGHARGHDDQVATATICPYSIVCGAFAPRVGSAMELLCPGAPFMSRARRGCGTCHGHGRHFARWHERCVRETHEGEIELLAVVPVLSSAQVALVALGRELQRDGYEFTTVTPRTHRLVNDRAEAQGQGLARNLRDVFGWSRPFAPTLLPPSLYELLEASEGLERSETSDLVRSRVRFSTLQRRIFVHSAFPTDQSDAVFFGPDTYRFCRLLQRWAPEQVDCAVDVCTGTGAGAITLAPRCDHVIAADVSARALSFAAVNATLASTPLRLVRADLLRGIDARPDLIVANPPYLRDVDGRMYRDGGGDHGEALSLRIVRESLVRLKVPGRLILYTGSAIVDGVDQLATAVSAMICEHGTGLAYELEYEELDPDVFGEELEEGAYQSAERIALVGLCLRLS